MTPASPTAALAGGEILQMPARVRHSRLGALRHAFTYRADYLLFAPEAVTHSKGLLRRNRRGLFSLWDRDHGGPPGAGQGALWAWEQFERAGMPRTPDMVLGLLTQPRFLGFGFNPVSFWLLFEGPHLRAVIAEVTNTWSQRHSYLCRSPDNRPLTGEIRLTRPKRLHVSPFQDLSGSYSFRFAISEGRADVLICHEGPKAGLVARMQGPLQPLRQRDLLTALATRPGGALRVVVLIYLRALRLKCLGAGWRPLPPAPAQEITE